MAGRHELAGREKVRGFIQYLGSVMLSAGYIASFTTGCLTLVTAVLYLSGGLPGFFSNPVLSVAMIASGLIALLLEVWGKALAPIEANRVELFLRWAFTRRKALPVRIDMAPLRAVVSET